MKNILILLTVLLLPTLAYAQSKSSFSSMEVNHVRVATPGLFAKSNHIYLHLDSLQEHEYAFPLPGAKVISAYGTRGGHSGADIKGMVSVPISPWVTSTAMLLMESYVCRSRIMLTEIWL